MSNEIKKLKNKLKVIRPLLQKDRIRLDEMKLQMQRRADLLDRATRKYDSLQAQKRALIEAMQSSLVSDNEISVGSMSNSRHFLNQLEESLQQAESDVDKRRAAVESLREQVLEHQLSINKLEKYQDKKDQSLCVEIEKDHMHTMDDLWMQRLAIEEKS